MHFSAKRGIAIACRLSVCLSVCPSVCLSVTLVDCIGADFPGAVGTNAPIGKGSVGACTQRKN